MTPSTASIPYGFCHCGCGKRTPLWKETDRSKNQVKGEPRKYLRQHSPRRNRVNFICSHCAEPAWARGLCAKHYTRWRTGIPLDAPDRYGQTDVNAVRDLYAKGWSSRKIAEKLGVSQNPILRIVRKLGIARSHAESTPFRSKDAGACRYQAKKIWCRHNGVDNIPKGYHVHHIDLDPTNNDISNLQLMLHGDHMRLHRKLEMEAKYGKA